MTIDHDDLAAARKAASIAQARGWDDEQMLDALARFIDQAGLTPLLVQYLEELGQG